MPESAQPKLHKNFSGSEAGGAPSGSLKETADYIRKMCRDLRRMAAQSHLPMLAYLLEMSELEAQQTVKGQITAIRSKDHKSSSE